MHDQTPPFFASVENDPKVIIYSCERQSLKPRKSPGHLRKSISLSIQIKPGAASGIRSGVQKMSV